MHTFLGRLEANGDMTCLYGDKNCKLFNDSCNVFIKHISKL